LVREFGKKFEICGQCAADPNAAILRIGEGHPDIDPIRNQDLQYGFDEICVSTAID